MNILITGGTGFIGQALTKHFLTKKDNVTILGRDDSKIKNIFGNNVKSTSWQEFNNDPTVALEDMDLIINLAGTNIGEKKWTKERKAEIIESRVNVTTLIAQACAKMNNPPTLFSASGIGIYGCSTTNKQFIENDQADNASNFLVQVALAWEQATQSAAKNTRVVQMRFAGVLGNGGLLKKMRLPFQLGLGGAMGNGEQPFPWIALHDLIRAIDFLIEHDQISGPVNFVAPECISQNQFAQAYASVLHRPHFLTTPAFAIKLAFGEMGELLLLNGQCAYPKVLLNSGFKFDYDKILPTLRSLQNSHD